jgi:hypothetical protein
MVCTPHIAELRSEYADIVLVFLTDQSVAARTTGLWARIMAISRSPDARHTTLSD